MRPTLLLGAFFLIPNEYLRVRLCGSFPSSALSSKSWPGHGSWSSQRSTSRRNTIPGGDALNAVSEALSILTDKYPKAEEALKRWQVKLHEAEVTFPAQPYYVPRPELENEIQEIYDNPLHPLGRDSYTIVVGVKGSGKSSLVQRVVGGKPGVLYVSVSSTDTPTLIVSKLLKIGGARDGGDLADVDVLTPLFEQAALKREGEKRITIVFEVERGGDTSSDAILYMVKSTAKRLALSSSVLIVLSEANAGLAFGDDVRQDFIWVDGMTHDEATVYAKKVFPAISDANLETFINEVGTIPLQVRRFAEALGRGKDAAAFIEASLCTAENDLAAFPHQAILEALKGSPDGIRVSKFKGIHSEGVNLAQPKDVAVAMKKCSAVIYHTPSGQYRLATRAHRTALLREI